MSDSILVIGAGGFVGRHLTRTLAARGESVIALSRKPLDFEAAGVESVTGELIAPEQFAPFVARSRAVVHLASGSTPGSSAGKAIGELHGNLLPTLALLQALQQKPQTKLLYFSSGGSIYAPEADELATESAQAQPRSYHGASKMAAEYFISAFCRQYEGAATLLRPSNIYGPGQSERAGFGIVPAAFGKMLHGEILTVWGDGSAIRDYLYIDDLVDLCTRVLSIPMPIGARVLNAASGVGVSLDDLFTTMETTTGRQLTRRYEVGRAVDAARVVMDASRANLHYGWRAATPLHDGLRKTWDWFTTTPH